MIKLPYRPLLAAILIGGATITGTSAAAATISGTISISGNDTFTSNQITFTPTTGTIYQASGSYGTFSPVAGGSSTANYLASLTSFTFANSAGILLFSSNNSLGQTASFTISSLTTKAIGTNSNGTTLSLTGLGTSILTGYDATSSQFTLVSSSLGASTGFQLVVGPAPAVVSSVPEPAVWTMMILGFGIMGGALRRRIRASEINFDTRIKRIAAGDLA